MITTNFNKYKEYARQKIEKLATCPKLKIEAKFEEDRSRINSSHFFLNFYQLQSFTYQIDIFIWDYSKEIKNNINGIINGEPKIEKLYLTLEENLSTEIKSAFFSINEKKDWKKEAIYLDGVPKKLLFNNIEYTWNIKSKNIILNELTSLIKKIK